MCLLPAHPVDMRLIPKETKVNFHFCLIHVFQHLGTQWAQFPLIPGLFGGFQKTPKMCINYVYTHYILLHAARGM